MVYKRLECIEAGRVTHTDYVYCEAISKSNTLMKFHRNRKRLRGLYKRWYIRGWVVSKRVVCLILTMFMLKL